MDLLIQRVFFAGQPEQVGHKPPYPRGSVACSLKEVILTEVCSVLSCSGEVSSAPLRAAGTERASSSIWVRRSAPSRTGPGSKLEDFAQGFATSLAKRQFALRFCDQRFKSRALSLGSGLHFLSKRLEFVLRLFNLLIGFGHRLDQTLILGRRTRLFLRLVSFGLLGFVPLYQACEVECEPHDLAGNPAVFIQKRDVARFICNLLFDGRSSIPANRFRQILNDVGSLENSLGALSGGFCGNA